MQRGAKGLEGLGREVGRTCGVFGLKPIVPPINSTRDLHIERPRPVPLYRFVALLSNCVKGVNKLFTVLNGIPTLSNQRVITDANTHVATLEHKKNVYDGVVVGNIKLYDQFDSRDSILEYRVQAVRIQGGERGNGTGIHTNTGISDFN